MTALVSTEGLRPSDSPTGSLAGAQRPAPLPRLTRYRSFALFVRSLLAMAPRALALFFVTVFVTVGVTVGPAAASAQPSGITNGQIFDALGIQSGSTVCEMGAGDGELSLAAAKIVGPEGRIYTSELGDDRLQALRDRMAAAP